MVRGEFAHKHHFLDQIEGKNEVLEKLRDLVAKASDKIDARALRDGLLVVHVDMFAFRKREMEISRLPLHQRAQACEELDADVKARLTNKALPLEAVVDWRLERADRLHQMRVRCTIAALA